MGMHKGFKIILWALLIVLALVLAVYAAVAILLPKEKIVEMIIPKAEQALNRKVSLGDVSFTVWGGIGLRLYDLEVANRQGFGRANMLELDHLDVKVKFLPLFSKRIEITKIVLDGLTVDLEKTNQGWRNFDDIGPAREPGAEISPAQTATMAAALPFSFDRLELANSRLEYNDDSAGYRISLDGIKFNSSLTPQNDPMILSSLGSLTVDSVRFTDKKKDRSYPAANVELKHDMLFDQRGDSLRINDLTFAVSSLRGKALGSVKNVRTGAIVDISVRTEDISIQDVLEALPPEYFAKSGKVSGSGKLHLVGRFHGPTKVTPETEFEAKLTMENMELSQERFKGKLQIQSAELNLSRNNLEFFTAEASLDDEPFSIKFILDNFADPSVSAELRMKSDLRFARQFMRPDAEASGTVAISASAYGRLKQPESISILGSLTLENLKYSTPTMYQPVTDFDAHVEFLGKDAEVSQFRVELGESDMGISGRIKNLAPYLLTRGKTSTKPFFTGEIVSDHLNIDRLLPNEDDSVYAAAVAAGDTAAFFLPDFDAEGTFNIKTGIYSLIAFENLTGRFDLAYHVLRIDTATADVYGGKAVGSAIIDIEDLNRPEFQVDYQARDVEVNNVLSRFTSFDDHLFGKVDMAGSFAGTGSEAEDILPTLRASGVNSIRDGRLVNFELANTFAQKAGIKLAEEETVRDLIGQHRIEDGRLFFDNLALGTSMGDWALSGSVGFDGSLNYSGRLTLSQSAAKNLDMLGGFGSLLRGSDGKVTVPFKLTGSYASPQVSIDTSPTAKNVDKAIKDEGKKLLDKLFKK
jgi:hypothetical protein